MVRAILKGGQSPQAAARAAGVCARTARKMGRPLQAEVGWPVGRPLLAPQAPAPPDEPSRRRGPVAAVDALGDDVLEPHGAGVAEHGLAFRAVQVVAVQRRLGLFDLLAE